MGTRYSGESRTECYDRRSWSRRQYRPDRNKGVLLVLETLPTEIHSVSRGRGCPEPHPKRRTCTRLTDLVTIREREWETGLSRTRKSPTYKTFTGLDLRFAHPQISVQSP